MFRLIHLFATNMLVLQLSFILWPRAVRPTRNPRTQKESARCRPFTGGLLSSRVEQAVQSSKADQAVKIDRAYLERNAIKNIDWKQQAINSCQVEFMI